MTGGEQLLFWMIGDRWRSSAALGLLFAKKAVHAALGMALVMIVLGHASTSPRARRSSASSRSSSTPAR